MPCPRFAAKLAPILCIRTRNAFFHSHGAEIGQRLFHTLNPVPALPECPPEIGPFATQEWASALALVDVYAG